MDKEYRPDQLIQDAAKHGELVVFVGAGTSMLCGSPNWHEFAKQVVDTLERAEGLSFLEAEQIRGLGDPRRTLSIAIGLAKEQGIAIDFDRILHPSIPAPVGTELYELLSNLRPVFVTTNYDKWLDEAGPEIATTPPEGAEHEPTKGPRKRPMYYLREHLTPDRLAERGAVIHLHGSYIEPRSMVVSLKDYIEHYADEKVQNFLSEMFKNYTVLFVGYGLAELEILDYIIRSNESLQTSQLVEPRHYLLYAHRSTESVQTRFIEQFFRDQCGVRVIPYCIDAKGHQELIAVFKCWKPELDVRDPTILDLQAHLDRYIEKPGPSQRESALRLVQKKPELTAYFINSLKDPIWFDDLVAADFFNTERSPEVRVINGKNGPVHQAEGWPALRYLEHIAPSVQKDQAMQIAEIIRVVTEDAQLRNLENWRTWWSLATIMSQLPLEVITESDLNMVRLWLTCRFEASMVGHELGEKLLPRLLDSPDPTNWQKAMLLVDAMSMLRPAEQK